MSKDLVQHRAGSANALFKFKCKLNVCMTLVLSSCFSMAAIAQDTTLTLSNAIDMVEQYQKKSGIFQAQDAINDANIQQSKLWKNPDFSIEQSGFDSKKDQELTIMLAQPLDVFGERKANQKRAEIAKTQTELKQKIYQTQLELIVKYAWSQLAIFELERKIVREQLQVSTENLDAIQKRMQAGSVAQVDVDRVRMSHAENIRLYRQANLQAQIAAQQLASMWGESNIVTVDQKVAGMLWPSSTDKNVQAYLADNLFEKARQLQVLDAEASLAYLKAQARPNPIVQAGIKRTNPSNAETENAVVVGVSIPLNIFNRQQYGIEIVKAKQDLLDKQQALYLKQNVLKVRTLLTELQGLEVQFNEVSNSQIPLAVQVQQKTLLGFKVGKFSVTDVQQATFQLQDVRLRKIQLLKDAWQLATEAESLSLGLDPSQITSRDAFIMLNQNFWQDTQALPVIGAEK